MPNFVKYKNISVGFTLVEIMLTVAILSFLTAAVLPGVGNFTDINILNQTLLNIASDLENTKFKALSGAYAGPPSKSESRVNWGLANCPSSSSQGSSYYTLAPFDISTKLPITGVYSRSITLPANTTIWCSSSSPVNIIFERLSGNLVSGGGVVITVRRGSYTGTVTVSNGGNISIKNSP